MKSCQSVVYLEWTGLINHNMLLYIVWVHFSCIVVPLYQDTFSNLPYVLRVISIIDIITSQVRRALLAFKGNCSMLVDSHGLSTFSLEKPPWIRILLVSWSVSPEVF